MSRRILVTGGAGFIGCHLVRHLAGEPGVEVVVVDDFSRGALDSELEQLSRGAAVDLVTVDLAQESQLDAISGRFDEIYHLAAVLGVKRVLDDPLHVLDVNVVGTLNLLRRLAELEHGRLLFASTSEVYAWTRQFHELPVPTPEDVPLAVTNLDDARSTYAASKIVSELAVTQWGKTFGKAVTIVRYHNVYGPRMGFDHVIPELYQRAVAGQDPLVVYSPKHRRAFCYVDDAVAATVAAARSSRTEGVTLNVGNDREEVEIEQLARRLLAAAGIERGIEGAAAANDPVDRRCPDISLARRLLGYEPRVMLDEGLALTVSWYAKALPPSVPA